MAKVLILGLNAHEEYGIKSLIIYELIIQIYSKTNFLEKYSLIIIDINFSLK